MTSRSTNRKNIHHNGMSSSSQVQQQLSMPLPLSSQHDRTTTTTKTAVGRISGGGNTAWIISLPTIRCLNQNHTIITTIVVTTVATILVSWFWYLTELIRHDSILHHGHSTIQFPSSSLHKMHDTFMSSSRMTTTTSMNKFCHFRRYPLHRYYNIDNDKPDFLSTAAGVEYIYGVWPTLLEQDKHFLPTDVSKICVNQSEWIEQSPSSSTVTTEENPPPKTTSTTWPFADGTNPSVLLLSRVQQQAPHVSNMILQHYPKTYYIVTVSMTNSQCTWNDTNSDPNLYDLPDLNQARPNTVRTIFQFLDINFHKLMETTIYLKRDAPWGKKMRRIDDVTSLAYTYVPGLDDARLFVHQSQIYVSYREGPSFGYDAQVLNPIHIVIETEMIATHNHTRVTTTHIISATIQASESSSFCCGRNMALLPDYGLVTGSQKLYALTWVDPVTVELVDTTPFYQMQHTAKRRLLQLDTTNNSDVYDDYQERLLPSVVHTHRRLKEEKHKSHIHGTNAFMVPIPSKDTNIVSYLGVAHFHRPGDRNPNEYARFGHHYTHAFYIISTTMTTNNNNYDAADLSNFHLTALSPEFVIRSRHQPEDAEIIQFISGLEYNSPTNQIILSYGINDCEGAIRRMDYSILQKLLRPVSAGKQVVDFMMPLKNRL